MNIAFFSDTYFPDKNGVATSIFQLRKNLRLLGHNVFIYTVKHRRKIVLNNEEGIMRLPSLPVIRGIPEARIAFANPASITKRLLRDQIDIVHTHSEFSLGLTGRFVSRLTNIPHIHTMHTMWKDYRHYMLNGFALKHQQIARLFKAFVRPCTTVIAPSKKAMLYLKDIGINAWHINNGLDIALFVAQISSKKQDEIRQKYEITKQDFIILFVGRISNEKRVCELVNILIHVMKKQPTIKAILIGYGDRSDQIQKSIARENLKNRFILTGPLPHEEIVNYYAISNLYCTASLSEVQPMTVIEAISMGLPVIARNDNALDTLVQNNVNGYTLQSDEEIVEFLIKLTQSRDIVEKMGQESLKIARQFASEIQTFQLVELYKQAIVAGRPNSKINTESLAKKDS